MNNRKALVNRTFLTMPKGTPLMGTKGLMAACPHLIHRVSGVITGTFYGLSRNHDSIRVIVDGTKYPGTYAPEFWVELTSDGHIEGSSEEPEINYTTVKDGDDVWHIECRFQDGQKYAAITVDKPLENLADRISAFLNGQTLSLLALKDKRIRELESQIEHYMRNWTPAKFPSVEAHLAEEDK